MIDFIRLRKNKEVWHCALHVSLYCRIQKTCDKCIFFDETITDKYERDIRLIQVDLIDELMEWMELTESEANDD